MRGWLAAPAFYRDPLRHLLRFGGWQIVAQGGGLVGAEWGVQGRRGVDVTARVRTFIHEGVLQLEATRFNLGIDPAPHENKVLVIHLRQRDGDVKDYSYPERSVVRLELDHEEWHGRREDQDRHDHDAHRPRAPAPP